ncbi:replication endonuclease [Parasalinivibrio latis]|uniref:replication endonuclease n=1 Tax=Parasalinivibrio latis TaxID=2952610 RepID=UPI0030DE99D6
MEKLQFSPEYIRAAVIACRNWSQQEMDLGEPETIEVPVRPTADRTPDDMTISERKLWDINPDDHNFRRQFFAGMPDYLTKYFADRYATIFTKEGRQEANTYLRKTMGGELQRRIRMVTEKYKNLPTVSKVALLSDDTEQSDASHPKEAGKLLAMMERAKPNRREKILAEMCQDEIKDMAFRIAGLFEEHLRIQIENAPEQNTAEENAIAIYDELAHLCCNFGIAPPVIKEKITHLDAECGLLRLICNKFWTRRLKRQRDVMREHLAIAMGAVSKAATPYCSLDCLSEYKAQRSRNWEAIKNMELFNEEDGETAELESMVLKSVANPAIRRHELMTRVRGCEDLAAKMELAGQFYTLTTPSAYHNSRKRGGFVEHWNGASPRDAQRYLCSTWAKIRAELARRDIRWFGIRVAEPHHDGTPHWHILLWLLPEQASDARNVFIDYATETDREELMGKKMPGPLNYSARCDVKAINPEEGTATGYIAKYISKNIDGYAMGDEISDETGKPVKDMARNVTAWASRWRIRQFQFFGGAPVTVWRELRRFANLDRDSFANYLNELARRDLVQLWDEMNTEIMGPHQPGRTLKNIEIRKRLTDRYQPSAEVEADVLAAMQSADEGNWEGYVMGQGGPFAKREEHKIKTHYEITPYGNDYGEAVRRVKGFNIFDELAGRMETKITRLKEWTIRKKSNTTAAPDAGALALSGGSAAPWSSVNNCTASGADSLNKDLGEVLRASIGPSSVNQENIDRLLAGQTLFTNDGTRFRLRSGAYNREKGSVPLELITESPAAHNVGRGWEGWDRPVPEKTATPKEKQTDLLPPHRFAGDLDDWSLI